MLRRLIAAVLVLDMALNAMANPTGMTVHGGSATAASSGSQLTVTTTSRNTFLNWQSFNIAAGETTIFQEPSTTSIVWNRINDQNPSQIFGSLQANGVVVLLNSSGFYFGPNSFVSAAGLVVSTANYIPPQNSGGGWEFNGPPPLASIINYGQIKVGNGGAAFLIADKIENHGSIEAPGGSVGLAAGQTVLLSERPDGRGMSMRVTLPGGSVDNEGRLIADGGTIAMHAQVVNQNGFIQANSVQNVNGVIELVASDQLTLGASSQIIASGDNSTSGSAGGNVTLQSGNNFSDSAGSQITVTGGTQGGNGGDVEISAPNVRSLNSSINARAQAGWLAGKLLLDPDYIILDTSGADTMSSGTVLVGDNPNGTGTLDLNVNSAFANLAVSQIILQALYDITITGGTSWNLSQTIGANFGGVTSGQLTLEAGRNITFQYDNASQSGSSISDANNWSVALYAGVSDFTPSTPTVKPGNGSISFFDEYDPNNPQPITKASGYIQTAQGDITLVAGEDITLGSAFVITTSGGSISAHALKGTIDTGDYAQGYSFLGQPNLNDGLGGISTEAGGDVTLIAGGDVNSVLPGNGNYYYDGNPVTPNNGDYTTAGSGAYGSQPGNVTIVAGGSVTGHYLVANGAGRIYAGVQMDDNGNPIVKTDSHGNPVNAVDGRGNAILLAANTGAVIGRDAQGNPILLDGGGNVIPTTSVTVVPNGTTTDANGNKVNAYIIKFIPKSGGPEQDENAYAMDAYALNSGSSGSAGTEQDQFHLALSLISGGWNVTAAQDIYLQEVRNPNGVFDINGGRFYTHYFNYAPGDFVNLNAGNLVQLGASPSVLPRPTGIKVPFIYPSILNVTAGADGVELTGGADPFNQLILFPSPQGSLTINTTDGGSLVGSLNSSGTVPQIFNLIVSDSSRNQYTANGNFGIGDHATSPVHLDNSTPITLNISGDMSMVLLAAPEAAQINVVGNMYNCRFQGMNMSANDVTSINVGQTAKDNMEKSGLLDPNTDSGIKVGGDIINRGAFTSVTLDLSQTDVQAPAMNYLSEAFGNSVSAATLTTSLYYNKDTQVLTYQNISGVKIDNVLDLLENLKIATKFDVNGNPTDQTTVSVLTPATAQALKDQYNAENAFSKLPAGSGPPDGTYGYIIGGGGQFNITARTIDLGTTAGIQSKGVGLYKVGGIYPLASLFGSGGVFDHGADITIITTGNHSAGQTAGDLVGDLDMYSSSIASLQGGDISIYSSEDVNAGSADFAVNTSSPRGIYSTGQGNVYVYANGDINVNGSRIAVYDTRQKKENSSGTPGGSVTVVSRNGNINAGSGGSGFVRVSSFLVNPDQSVLDPSYTIPGSGIMEVSYTRNGNILVEAPNGTVNAAAGGILQLLLNGPPLPESTTLFGLPLKGLAKMFNLALNGKMKAALDLQKTLNGDPGNCVVDVFGGYQLQELAYSLSDAEIKAGDTLQKLPDGLQEVVDPSGNLIELAYSLSDAEIKAGDTLQKVPDGLQEVVDKNKYTIVNALNLFDSTPVTISPNQGIDATGSGVIGVGTVTIKGTGKIKGTFYTRGNLNINAVQDIDVIALAGGKADLTGSSLDKSTVIAIGGIDAVGDTGTATLLSNDAISGGQGGLAPGTAADAASQGAASENSVSPAKNDDTTATDDDMKKKGKAAATVQKRGRVTVLLPPKHLSQNQTSNNHL
jgi:filamentous hemagglutinin family protein